MENNSNFNANLYACLSACFPDNDETAIELPGERALSWRQLREGAGRVAGWLLSLGLPEGARVAVQLEKSPEAVCLYLGVIQAGYVFLPLNTAYRAGEIDYFLNDASPSVVVCSPPNIDWVYPLAQAAGCRHVASLGVSREGTLWAALGSVAPESTVAIKRTGDLAAILYTSGTTGRSKGAMLSHGNLWSNALTLKSYWHWQKGDVLLHVLPIFHVHGLFVAIHGALINGSKMLWMNSFDPAKAIDCFAQATVLMGVPTHYVRLLQEPGLSPATCATMRLFISGSAPLLRETFDLWREKTGHTILERYGMSETVMLTSNPYSGARKAGTVGFPLPEVSVRVVNAQAGSAQSLPVGEPGDIQVQGPNVFAGYWQMPEKTAEEFTADGYFKTGDVGFFDAEGYLNIVGRSKDLIISGGYNVYPKEIELLLDEQPEVLESAVIGVPHPDFGEAVIAVLVLRPGADLDEAAMIAALKSKIANYKVPKRLHVVSELPRNAMGKVQKNILRQRFCA